MNITRVSIVSGIERTMILPITDMQWQNYLDGMNIQRALGHLTASQREFIISGMTDDEWDQAMKDIGDEEE